MTFWLMEGVTLWELLIYPIFQVGENYEKNLNFGRPCDGTLVWG